MIHMLVLVIGLCNEASKYLIWMIEFKLDQMLEEFKGYIRAIGIEINAGRIRQHSCHTDVSVVQAS